MSVNIGLVSSSSFYLLLCWCCLYGKDVSQKSLKRGIVCFFKTLYSYAGASVVTLCDVQLQKIPPFILFHLFKLLSLKTSLFHKSPIPLEAYLASSLYNIGIVHLNPYLKHVPFLKCFITYSMVWIQQNIYLCFKEGVFFVCFCFVLFSYQASCCPPL